MLLVKCDFTHDYRTWTEIRIWSCISSNLYCFRRESEDTVGRRTSVDQGAGFGRKASVVEQMDRRKSSTSDQPSSVSMYFKRSPTTTRRDSGEFGSGMYVTFSSKKLNKMLTHFHGQPTVNMKNSRLLQCREEE